MSSVYQRFAKLKNARNLLRRHELVAHHYFSKDAERQFDLHQKFGMAFFSSSMTKIAIAWITNFLKRFIDSSTSNTSPITYSVFYMYGKQCMLPRSVRTLSSNSSQSSRQTPEEGARKDISTVEDPFDAPTSHIPEKPVTFTEGASYSVVILAGLGIAGLAAYAVFKELIFEPKEYKIFGKALERIQHDNQVTVRIGSPVTGYGSESRNRAARQRIPNRVWTDEHGVEHVEVNFYIRGPRGAGKVYSEMFKDREDKKWKFTYLIVEITSPSPTQLILESYIGA